MRAQAVFLFAIVGCMATFVLFGILYLIATANIDGGAEVGYAACFYIPLFVVAGWIACKSLIKARELWNK